VSHEEYLTFNVKCRKFELILKILKVKPFDFTPLAFKYAKEYSLNCIKVRTLDLRKKLFNMRLKNDELKQELEGTHVYGQCSHRFRHLCIKRDL
jgi:hypothetical protein